MTIVFDFNHARFLQLNQGIGDATQPIMLPMPAMSWTAFWCNSLVAIGGLACVRFECRALDRAGDEMVASVYRTKADI